MEQECNRYYAYMLRMWQVKDRGQLVWRISLENAHTRERIGFRNLDELFSYLKQMPSKLSDTFDMSQEEND